MALLRELQKFADDSTQSVPVVEATGAPDTAHPDYESIVAARAFREKIQMVIVLFARSIAGGVTFSIAGRDPFPAVIDGTNTEIAEANGWSQAVLANPRGETLTRAFHLALANNPDINTSNPFASIAFVRLLGHDPDATTEQNYATDASLRTALVPLLPLMVKGYRPGR